MNVDDLYLADDLIAADVQKMQEPVFESFSKIARLSRQCIITEKIDGTNAQVFIGDDGSIRAGSRNRWITTSDDNYGFARWVELHADELKQLGPGRHFGEWWGAGIQRRYGMEEGEKFFSLFDILRWKPKPLDGSGNAWGRAGDRKGNFLPECCQVVPELYFGPFTTDGILGALSDLRCNGSVAAPGFMQPEGIVIYHCAARMLFKKTLDNDDQAKTQ